MRGPAFILVASLIIPAFAAPLPAKDISTLQSMSLSRRDLLINVDLARAVLSRGTNVEALPGVQEIKRGIIEPSGGGDSDELDVSDSQNSSKRGVIIPSGGKRGVIVPSGGDDSGKRGVIVPSGGKRGVIVPSGGKRGVIVPSGGDDSDQRDISRRNSSKRHALVTDDDNEKRDVSDDLKSSKRDRTVQDGIDSDTKFMLGHEIFEADGSKKGKA